MSWVEFAPATLVRDTGAAVTVAVSRKRRLQQLLSVTVKAGDVAGFGDWWDAGRRVSVQTGVGDHAGRVRVAADVSGRFALSRLGGQNRKGGAVAPTLLLRGFPGLPEAGHARASVKFSFGPGWLEIVLPAWIGAAALPAAKPVRAPAAPVAEKRAAVPAASVPAAPLPVRHVLPSLSPIKMEVLRKLQAAGGQVRLEALRHAEGGMLRDCEELGYAVWESGKKVWALTGRGTELLERSAGSAA